MQKNYRLFLLPLFSLLGLIAAGVFYIAGVPGASVFLLKCIIIAGGLVLLVALLKEIFRKRFGVDVIAVSAIAVSFLLKEYWAGAVIVLMMSGGEALEAYALTRAKRQLTVLLSRVPSMAHKQNGSVLEDISIYRLQPGDIVIVKPGEIIPVDGTVLEGSSEVNESAITGESLPVAKHIHSLVASGSLNSEAVLKICAVHSARESHYEQIIKMVKEAASSKAPIARLADRYAIWFTVLTFTIAACVWFITHNSVLLLAVLVVATPCPLLLATPIAIMSGISWAASRGIMVKSGGALEVLGEAKSFVFDKTGTLTVGSPKVLGAESHAMNSSELLFLAASLDQLSAHIFARSLVQFAHEQLHKQLLYPEQFEEFLGEGVRGIIGGKQYILGKLAFLKSRGVTILQQHEEEYKRFQDAGIIPVYMGEEKTLLGQVLFADTVRPEIKSVFHSIRQQGISRIMMLTGDRKEIAERIAKGLGISEYQAQVLPGQKLAAVAKLQKQFAPVVMVGDGINDAPALAAADVGIALGTSGLTAASEAGDIVITGNTLERLSEAVYIAQRVLVTAKQGIFFGMGVSLVLMIMAAFGYIPPVYGALVQEILDVVVILNALRINFERKHFS